MVHKYKQGPNYKGKLYFYCINKCGGSVQSTDWEIFDLQKPHSANCPGYKEMVGTLTALTVSKVDEELKRGVQPRNIVSILHHKFTIQYQTMVTGANDPLNVAETPSQNQIYERQRQLRNYEMPFANV